ncbi:hypothetical protein Y900_011500 [Mycolicibacterium aromaticivorans JS19b1 = JCM 16368]|uniref:PE-PGRS family protein n=1 Tax=Mycolicibacterium aromaticivorans JS19b1 = JCM 16368 TaxID=1440774 RepID=A0A064CLE9_9MYCO|nr:hypothetical protein [Mycolicibacterium aromaticivorans]KDE99548.1 hypothetical protein Y900_011500 [Mycolicibacterium aromaticivorans JS19b1 = JCM 16368]
MQLSVRSMLATGLSLTAAATIALAPLPTDPQPATRAVPVVLTGAWQTLQENVQADIANLASMVVNYPPAPILTQVAENFTTYSHWLVGQDGGTPLKIVQTMGDHAAAAAGVMATLAVMAPLSLIGPFIAPGVMIAQLIADTAKYPSTPETVLQAFIDAPAVYLNTTLNCCSTPLFQLAFGLLNPGPLGYLLSFGPSIAKALQITPPAQPAQPVAATTPQRSAPSAVASPSEATNPAVGQSRRSASVTGAQQSVAPSAAKPPNASRKAAGAGAPKVASGGKGRSARPGSQETR